MSVYSTIDLLGVTSTWGPFSRSRAASARTAHASLPARRAGTVAPFHLPRHPGGRQELRGAKPEFEHPSGARPHTAHGLAMACVASGSAMRPVLAPVIS